MRNAKLIALLAAVLLCGCDDKDRCCCGNKPVNVPEPSSLQLLAMGFIAVGIAKEIQYGIIRKRKRNNG